MSYASNQGSTGDQGDQGDQGSMGQAESGSTENAASSPMPSDTQSVISTSAASTDPMAATLSMSQDSAAEPLGQLARQRLFELVSNINVMLAYMNQNGIPLSSDLQIKLDNLLTNPDFDKYYSPR